MCLRIYRCGRRGLCGPNGDAHGGDSLLGECGAFLAEHGIFLLSHWTERDGHSCRGADAQCLAPAAAAGPAAAGRGGSGRPNMGSVTGARCRRTSNRRLDGIERCLGGRSLHGMGTVPIPCRLRDWLGVLLGRRLRVYCVLPAEVRKRRKAAWPSGVRLKTPASSRTREKTLPVSRRRIFLVVAGVNTYCCFRPSTQSACFARGDIGADVPALDNGLL